MFIVDSGKMAKLMAMGHIIVTKVGPSIQAIFMKINSLAQVEKSGQMVPSIRVVSSWVKSMGMGPINGLMGLSM